MAAEDVVAQFPVEYRGSSQFPCKRDIARLRVGGGEIQSGARRAVAIVDATKIQRLISDALHQLATEFASHASRESPLVAGSPRTVIDGRNGGCVWGPAQ